MIAEPYQGTQYILNSYYFTPAPGSEPITYSCTCRNTTQIIQLHQIKSTRLNNRGYKPFSIVLNYMLSKLFEETMPSFTSLFDLFKYFKVCTGLIYLISRKVRISCNT